MKYLNGRLIELRKDDSELEEDILNPAWVIKEDAEWGSDCCRDMITRKEGKYTCSSCEDLCFIQGSFLWN